MITVKQKGDWSKTTKFLNSITKEEFFSKLDEYGQMGVYALASATPKRTGRTSASWSYAVTKSRSGAKIDWYNSNINDGVPIAIIIQYGHGTGPGVYVEGIDYVNPAIESVYEYAKEDVWRKVVI